MSSVRCKGLRPLSFFVLGLHVAASAQAQVTPPWRVDAVGSRDVTVWIDQAQPAAAPASNQPTDDAVFAAIARGGPETAAQLQPLQGSLPALFAHARAGRWTEWLDAIKAAAPAPDVRDRDGATLLTLAARQGRLDAVRELLRRGADVDRRGLNGYTPLGAAAVGGNDLVVQELLRAGADPELWGSQGLAPLHLAAREGHVRAVRSLLKAGAQPLALSHAGRHALQEAAGTGHIEAMAALVDAGVPAGSVDRHGLNAVHTAALNRHFEAVAWLRERGAPVTHPLTQVLIDRPADPLPVYP